MFYMPKSNSCDWGYLNNYLTKNSNVFKLPLQQPVTKKETDLTAAELNDIT